MGRPLCVRGRRLHQRHAQVANGMKNTRSIGPFIAVPQLPYPKPLPLSGFFFQEKATLLDAGEGT